MPVYPCPECGAQLRPANPVAPGKKLRCPKCETVFAPTREASKPAPPVAKAARRADDDEDEGGTYGMVQEKADEGAAAKREMAFGPIKDRFARSARGPALVHVVKPSTWLLATGILICVFAVGGSLYSIWPLVFKVEDVQPPEKGKPVQTDPSKRRFIEPTPEQWNMRWYMLGGCVFQFAWGMVVCAGASKMHMLESYRLAMIGSAMALVGPGVPLGVYMLIDSLKTDDTYWAFVSVLLIALPGVPISMWCLATLRRKDVRDGFAEEKPED